MRRVLGKSRRDSSSVISYDKIARYILVIIGRTVQCIPHHDAGHSRGNAALEHVQGVLGNDLRGNLVRALGARGDHGRLQQDTLEHDVVLCEEVEGLGPGLLGDLEGPVDGVRAVEEDLGLDNGHKAVILGDGGIAGKAPCALVNSKLRGAVRDAHNGAPLGEAGTLLVVGGSAGGKAVETLAPGLVVGASKGNKTL